MHIKTTESNELFSLAIRVFFIRANKLCASYGCDQINRIVGLEYVVLVFFKFSFALNIHSENAPRISVARKRYAVFNKYVKQIVSSHVNPNLEYKS